jgi:hypothetical protein
MSRSTAQLIYGALVVAGLAFMLMPLSAWLHTTFAVEGGMAFFVSLLLVVLVPALSVLVMRERL